MGLVCIPFYASGSKSRVMVNLREKWSKIKLIHRCLWAKAFNFDISWGYTVQPGQAHINMHQKLASTGRIKCMASYHLCYWGVEEEYTHIFTFICIKYLWWLKELGGGSIRGGKETFYCIPFWILNHVNNQKTKFSTDLNSACMYSAMCWLGGCWQNWA